MYSITLIDCRGADHAAKDQAVDAYRQAIEQHLGGAENVLTAYREYRDVFNKYEETPLPPEAPDEERAIVTRWESAESAGYDAAFSGWLRVPDAAHFEISAT